ncbi:helix-turn-helix transcriptional regulator [Rhizorhabdus sp.]|uniref:helix-turn-helix transcriptional regulator n=1 Tax=Rhizorhabdus sp. TaxID=1968843 RepID=UPI0035B3291A
MRPSNRIRELRKKAGLSQGQLGEMCGLSQEQISQLENDKRPLSLDYMRAISRSIGCSVADLLPDEDNPERLAADERELIEDYRHAEGTAQQFIRTSAKAVSSGGATVKAA